MRGVMLEVPAHLLRERARTGADRFDEMWEGELHMVPPPTGEHQRISFELLQLLTPLASEVGLTLRYELGLFDPQVPGPTSYRQPDLVLFDPAVGSERGVEGAAALVIEIRSPDDETLEKVPFYERVGVAEVLVVDRDTKAVRHWVGAAGRLVEQPPAADGWVVLVAVAMTVRQVGGALEVSTAGGPTRI